MCVIFIRSCRAIMISARYFYHPDSSAMIVALERRYVIWTSWRNTSSGLAKPEPGVRSFVCHSATGRWPPFQAGPGDCHTFALSNASVCWLTHMCWVGRQEKRGNKTLNLRLLLCSCLGRNNIEKCKKAEEKYRSLFLFEGLIIFIVFLVFMQKRYKKSSMTV